MNDELSVDRKLFNEPYVGWASGLSSIWFYGELSPACPPNHGI